MDEKQALEILGDEGKKKNVNISLSPEIHKKAVKILKAQNITLSRYVNLCLKTLVESMENVKKNMGDKKE